MVLSRYGRLLDLDLQETPGKESLVVTLDALPGMEIWLAWRSTFL